MKIKQTFWLAFTHHVGFNSSLNYQDVEMEHLHTPCVVNIGWAQEISSEATATDELH